MSPPIYKTTSVPMPVIQVSSSIDYTLIRGNGKIILKSTSYNSSEIFDGDTKETRLTRAVSQPGDFITNKNKVEEEKESANKSDVPEIIKDTIESYCEICYRNKDDFLTEKDDGKDIKICNTKDFCPSKDECDTDICTYCLKVYFSEPVKQSAGYIVQMKCPDVTCQKVIPSKIWKNYVENSLYEMFKVRATNLFNVRCDYCDETKSLKTLHSVTGEKRAELPEPLRKIAHRILNNKLTLDEAIDKIHLMKCCDHETTVAECYASQHDCDNKTMFLVFHLLRNHIEVACAFLFRVLARYRNVTLACCNYSVCFFCQLAYHEGACENQETELHNDVRQCPNCNITLMRSEGCSDVQCICGESFDWNYQ